MHKKRKIYFTLKMFHQAKIKCNFINKGKMNRCTQRGR